MSLYITPEPDAFKENTFSNDVSTSNVAPYCYNGSGLSRCSLSNRFSKMAHVSVHVVTYNSANTITRCLQAVLAQRNVKFSICVIDNASTDDTVRRVREMGI